MKINNKGSIAGLALIALANTPVQAVTLSETVQSALWASPVVAERLRNYRATIQDLKIAHSGYYPKLDLVAGVGFEEAKSASTQFNTRNYDFYESSIVLSQNLFDGFGTTHQVSFQQQRLLAAAHNYIEKVNDTTLNMTNVYLQLMRNRELLKVTEQNVQIHLNIYDKVKALYDAGQTTASEVEKIKSSVSLAQSNLIVQQNNLMDARFNFQRVLGRSIQENDLLKPVFTTKLPATLEEATSYAIVHNPSIITSSHNVQALAELRDERKKSYLPKVDLLVSQSFNHQDDSLYGGDNNSGRVSLVFSYNLFNGGADRAEVQKQVSKVVQEQDISRDLKRQVIEGTSLSWSAYTMLEQQLDYLTNFRNFSDKTLNLYTEEYDFGKRSLLDVLAAQNDFTSAQKEIITAEYNLLFAKYRILDSMSLLVVSLFGDSNDYMEQVGLMAQLPNFTEDTLPTSQDIDNDDVIEALDLCDNSSVTTVNKYGCQESNTAIQDDSTNNLRRLDW